MSKILVPIDFSENSILALETALVLANNMQADLRMINVTLSNQKRNYAKGFEIQLPGMETSPQQRLDALVAKYEQRYAVKGRFDYKILEGNVAEELINATKYEQATLVVTGSHGVSGLSKNWIGGNAFKLICNATCPVLVIRPDMQFDNNFRNMLVPISIQKSSRRMVPTAAALAKLFSAPVTLVGIQTTSMLNIFSRVSSAVRQVENYLKQNGVEVKSTTMLKGKESFERLFEIAKESKADVMTIDVTNTGSFLIDRFRPELTNVINNSPCPVLAVPTAHEITAR